MKKEIKEILDTKGKFRCVRFASGEVGLVDGQDNALQVLGQWDDLKFGTRGFLHITNQGRSAYMDMKNGELYAQMPEFMNIGRFELTVIGGYMCTRTKKIYETPEVPKEILQAVDHGMYLVLPFDGEPSDEIKNRMIVRKKPYLVCLLDGDDSGVYWLIDSFADDSPLVMDDEGNYFHAEMDKMTRKAVKTALGKVDNVAAKAMMTYRTREISAVKDQLMKDRKAAARERAARNRVKNMEAIAGAEPFRIGNKWGLRIDGRIAVPPIYRTVEPPIGHYCVMENTCGCWGVVAVDGKVEIDPRYEKVVLHEDGTAELTVFKGKVITKKLGN